MPDRRASSHDRFHGRVETGTATCAHPDCGEPGEFRARALDGRRSGSDGPGEYRLLCLDHIREFNAKYDWFSGMDADQIAAAQSPTYMWPNETRAFSASAGVDSPPKWQDFHDPLDAIGSRFRANVGMRAAETRASPLTAAERKALQVLGLGSDADMKAIRRAYSNKLRAFHPDRNGGNRSHEKKLQAVLDAWATLRKSDIFS